MEELKYWVWLSYAFGAGNIRLWDVLNHYASVSEAYEAISSGECEYLTIGERRRFSSVHMSQCESIIDYCEKKKYKILPFDSDEYPDRLRGIYNPPALLFCYGSLDGLDSEPALSVVGTRKPSQYSVDVTRKICTELVRVGMIIISGFALGIDSMAHQSALKNGGKTIAVLGCGLDYDYPKENAPVKEVIARRGAVVTEYFPGTKPSPITFPARNRILSGLGLGTLVIEASVKSGALITVEHAIQQGKDIFCVPPADIYDERYGGAVRLLRDGAIPVFGHLDILYEYYENFTHKLNAIQKKPEFFMNSEPSSQLKPSRKSVTKEEPETASESEDLSEVVIDEALPEIQKNILGILKEENNLLADEISEKSGVEISDLLVELTEMEIMGLIRALPGNRYTIIK